MYIYNSGFNPTIKKIKRKDFLHGRVKNRFYKKIKKKLNINIFT